MCGRVARLIPGGVTRSMTSSRRDNILECDGGVLMRIGGWGGASCEVACVVEGRIRSAILELRLLDLRV